MYSRFIDNYDLSGCGAMFLILKYYHDHDMVNSVSNNKCETRSNQPIILCYNNDNNNDN